jgi:hypothetical protein
LYVTNIGDLSYKIDVSKPFDNASLKSCLCPAGKTCFEVNSAKHFAKLYRLVLPDNFALNINAPTSPFEPCKMPCKKILYKSCTFVPSGEGRI